MGVLRLGSLLSVILLLSAVSSFFAGDESSKTCLSAYSEGGVQSVNRLSNSHGWNVEPFDFGFDERFSNSTSSKCSNATLQGHRRYQEDRILSLLNTRVPFSTGAQGVSELVVDILAIFDGHGGAEASDLASRVLLDYFLLYTYHISSDASGYGMEILKESIERAIYHIDASFSKVAIKYNLSAGSTATIVLVANGQVLAANVGDSKAILCSQQFLAPKDAEAFLNKLCEQKIRDGLTTDIQDCGDLKTMASNGLTLPFAKALTSDHRPDRYDEKARIEMAGGFVVKLWGVPRVNGQLAVSRAIGDVALKRYGVTSEPEITDWQPLTSNDSYIVVASDGLFETLDSQDVCNLLWEAEGEYPFGFRGTSSTCNSSLADCLVKTAFERGSNDNISAVVYRLGNSE